MTAFLRQGDLIRVHRAGLIGEASNRNPFCQQILEILEEAARTHTPPKAWLAISWRQFLYWFADVEDRLKRGNANVETILRAADAYWSKLDKAKILLEERFNDGTWIRIWLNALNEFMSIR